MNKQQFCRGLRFISGVLFFSGCQAIDNPHFYRANFFWGEPRFEKNWLTTWDFYISGGNTKKLSIAMEKKLRF